jgi:LPS-assembly protein
MWQSGNCLAVSLATASELKRLKPRILLVCLGAILASTVWGQKPHGAMPIEITAEGANSYQDGIAYAEGNVVVRYGLDTIYADQITFDEKKREVTARGNVRIFAENQTYRGEFLTYNLESQQVRSEDFRTAQERMFAYGENVESPAADYFVITNGGLTTENREEPSYTLRAGTLEIYPDDLAVFRNVAVYIGKVPVMWLPYVAVPLGGNMDAFEFGAGSRSDWGSFVMGSYTTALDSQWTTTLHSEFRSRRGPSGGVDVFYNPLPGRQANFKSFWIQDWDTGIDLDPEERPVEPDETRYRFGFQSVYELTPDLTARADLNIWSDRHVTEDFYPDEFREEREPDNYLELTYYDPNFTATILGRFQVNNLFSPPERQPEFLLEFKRQKLFNTPLTYEGETGFVYFNREVDRDFAADTGAMPYDAVRYDTFHQLLFPRQYFGWLSVTPSAGVRGTYYSDSNLGDDPGGNAKRLAFNAGLDASFKLSRTWADVQMPHLGIEGLRHVIEPYATALYIPKPNLSTDDFAGFDSRLQSTRLQPLTFTAFNSADSITEVGAVRHGVRNTLQTKRDGMNYDLLDWAIYAQANFLRADHTNFSGMPGYTDMGLLSDDLYSHIFNEIEFRPLPWLRYELYAGAPLVSDTFAEVFQKLTWQVHPSVELEFKHRYLNNLDIDGISFDDSQSIGFGTFWRLDENWQVAGEVNFEADDKTLEESTLTLYRDLRAWKSGMTLARRDERDNDVEYLVYLTLTLKAFPGSALKVSQ